ncbi:MAG: hypothetical protein JWL61_2373 [Gemmatimonadetes bacterium]|nr:hypothetical protein [Gemmatimonadota bacterium]
MRRQKPRNTTDVTFEADIIGGASAHDARAEGNLTITNETETVDDEIATANSEASDADSLVIAIQLQAYALYLLRGETHGDDVADWLEAERIVRRLRS